MSKSITIHLPDEIAHYEGDLRFFFDLMVFKLNLNRHKGFGEGKDPTDLADRADDELTELRDACERGSQADVVMEAADVANFAWLTALCVSRMTKKEFEALR